MYSLQIRINILLKGLLIKIKNKKGINYYIKLLSIRKRNKSNIISGLYCSLWLVSSHLIILLILKINILRAQPLTNLNSYSEIKIRFKA